MDMSSRTYRLRKGKAGNALRLSARRRKKRGEFLAKWRDQRRNLEVVEVGVSAEATSSGSIEEIPLTPDTSDPPFNETLHDLSYDELIVAEEEVVEKKIGGVTGRRIVDLCYFINRIQSIDHSPFPCSFKDLTLSRERRFGLRSCLIFVCRNCHVKEHIWTDYKDSKKVEINFSAVSGVMSSGGGYSQLEGILTAIDIPAMASKTYKKYHDKVCEGWEKCATQEMETAAKREAAIAIERGDVDVDGTPLITVVADGSWCKRSYRNNYSSSAGVGAIIGYNTRKVLFIGVKNKYCTLCARAASKDEDPPHHDCCKNWDSNKSSSAMESAAIVEGFSRSEEMYGLRFSRVIADGDSSVYKKILDSRPYRNLTVEKIECRNHLLRNYCNKLKDLVIKCNRERCDIMQRKLLGKNILRLRMAVVKAIDFRKNEDKPLQQKILNLREDIVNSPSHVFGEHKACKQLRYFCDGTNPPNRKNEVPSLRICGLYDRIMDVVHYIARHARSLIFDVDNNAAEHYNSIVCKLIGGKRVNYALSGSYKGRCAGAVVSVNTGNPLGKLYKTALNSSPGFHTKKSLLQRQRKNLANKIRRMNRTSRRKLFTKSVRPDPDYGPRSNKPDMEKEEFEKEAHEFLDSLKMDHSSIQKLERATITQRESMLWIDMRRKILTASNFARVCKMRPYTGCEKILKYILYSHFDSANLQYGRVNEERARLHLERVEGIKVDPCGLFVDKDFPFLGASPDGLIGDTGIVEIKCPSSAAELTPEEAVNSRRINFWNQKKGMAINKNHNYFYQIQGQLHISRREYCILVVWTPKGVKTEKIFRDDNFWHTCMIEKLRKFYITCMLPELVDPRYPRSMPMRIPPHILVAQDEKTKKRKNVELTKNPKKMRNK